MKLVGKFECSKMVEGYHVMLCFFLYKRNNSVTKGHECLENFTHGMTGVDSKFSFSYKIRLDISCESSAGR